MMEITLRLSDGQKKTFSEEELIAIVEEHLQNQKAQTKKETTEFAPVPMEGRWFKVEPLTIDQNLFKENREDSREETTRRYILEAFDEMKKDARYARTFKTMMPEKTWESKTISELEMLANNLGDHMADWVEQALEWAQRIANGESWEDICNKEDTAKWYRLVKWKHRHHRPVGGSRIYYNVKPASYVDYNNYSGCNCFGSTVPLVVSYDV